MELPGTPQREAHAHSLRDPHAFWAAEAAHLSWHRSPSTIFQADPTHSHRWSWYADGELSGSWNLLGRHIAAGYGERPALFWESPVTGSSRTVSYAELLQEVVELAGVLAELGVTLGDRVVIYMPMIPAAVVAMLACTHLGAVHSVVFGGFAPAELAKRIEGATPTIILTASCGIESGSSGTRTIPYLPLVRNGIAKSAHKPRYTIVYNRPEFFQQTNKSQGELQWIQLVRSYRARQGLRPVPLHSSPSSFSPSLSQADIPTGAILPATAPHYLIPTSGTTGTPKSVLRPLGGYLVGLLYTARHLFGLTRESTIFTASDIGWVVGHCYTVYAPLLAGAASVLYEGKPVGTPDASAFWRICEKRRVDVLFTAPSALRAINAVDPDARGWEGGGLRALRGIFLAGERSEPELVRQYQGLLGRHGAPGARVIDNYWSSESGSPITGLFLSSSAPDPAVPGSAGLPLPGWDVRCVSDAGVEVPWGTMGNLVLALPLAPTALAGLYNDDRRYYDSYFGRFGGRWFDTGDSGVINASGYVTVLARTDDVLNVAAHRLSTASIEGAVRGVDGVAEAYVVPVRDEMKGQRPVAFVVLRAGRVMGEMEWNIKKAVRREVGAFAGLKAVVDIPAAAVPRTRSGKVLRRAFRGLVDGKEVPVPEGVEGTVWRDVEDRVKGVIEKMGREESIKAKL